MQSMTHGKVLKTPEWARECCAKKCDDEKPRHTRCGIPRDVSGVTWTIVSTANPPAAVEVNVTGLATGKTTGNLKRCQQFTYKRDTGSQKQDPDEQVLKLLNDQLPDALT